MLVVFNQRGAFGVKARGRGEARLDDPLALGVDIAPQVALADGGQAILKRRGLRVGGRDGHAALLVDIAPGARLVAARPGQHAGQAFAEGLMADRVRALAVVAGGALVQPGIGTRRIGQGGQGQRQGQRQGLDRGAHHANTRAGAAKRGKPSRTCHMVVCLARICEGSTVTSSCGGQTGKCNDRKRSVNRWPFFAFPRRMQPAKNNRLKARRGPSVIKPQCLPCRGPAYDQRGTPCRRPLFRLPPLLQALLLHVLLRRIPTHRLPMLHACGCWCWQAASSWAWPWACATCRACSSCPCRWTGAGAATPSPWRWPCRTSPGASRSRLPAWWPTAMDRPRSSRAGWCSTRWAWSAWRMPSRPWRSC
ncbi:hypothetical protein D3C87_1299320 [compost metagenome]